MATDPRSDDPPAPGPARDAGDHEVPTHRRHVDLDVFEHDGEFEVVGRLRDERPWAAGSGHVEHVHDMELAVTVRRSDLTVTAARARMRRFPHHECPEIEDAFSGLVGLCVARGYSRAVQERFGRSLGCAHLELLARMVGPAVIQAIPSSTLRHQGVEQAGSMLAGAGAAWLSDTCTCGATADRVRPSWPSAGGRGRPPTPHPPSRSSRPGAAGMRPSRRAGERARPADSSWSPAVR